MARIKSIYRIEITPEGGSSVVLVDYGDYLDLDQPIQFKQEREHSIDAPINNHAAYIHDGKTVTSSLSITKVERFGGAAEAQERLTRSLVDMVGIGKGDLSISTLRGTTIKADAIMTGFEPTLRDALGKPEVTTTYNFTLTNFRHE